MSKSLLAFTDRGIYCEVGDFYIDPWRPVQQAVITHGHSDHARWGHKAYVSHHHSIPIIRHRLGEIKAIGVAFGETFVKNGVRISLHPAGHVLGSAQVRVEYKGQVWVVSGDYKVEPDPIATDFEPVRCHTFITECTFGLPVYNWPDPVDVFTDIESWWKKNQSEGKVSLLTAYSLGKAQRILEQVEELGPVYVHGAIHYMNEVFRDMGKLTSSAKYLLSTVKKEELKGALVIAPPSALNSSWVNKLKPYSTAAASGWMMLRGSKRRRNVDRGFILSDHADWPGLNTAIESTGAETIISTHGYTSGFTRWLSERGYQAYEENTLFEGETVDEEVTS